MKTMRMGLTAEEEQEVAVDDMATRMRVWARKLGLMNSEFFKLVGEAVMAGPPLNPEERALLRTHGIDDEQFHAINQKDGGVEYRALMARRAKGGAAA